MYRVDFKTGNNVDLGLTTLSVGRRQRAEERLEIHSIPESNQDAIEHTGFFIPYERSMEFYVADDSQISVINNWLYGYGKLRVSKEPGGFYRAHVVSGLEYDKYLQIKDRMKVTFRINPPFFYLESGELPITLTAPGTINNPGTHISEPLIRIVGEGNITFTINGRTLTLTGIETFIDIDPELTIPYFKNNENVGDKVVGDEPYFDVGDNVISWTGNVTEVNILGRWREL